ncbi:MAG: SH3 domain-containing protein [Steroidobacteraceae bacterium]
MIRTLLAAVMMLGTLFPAALTAASGGSRVVVQDPYLEFRSGPGRGYPAFHVVDRGESVELLRRRTDWIKVRSDGGKEGWVHRNQLVRTLTPSGEAVTLPAPSPESRTGHRWEVGLATGDFDGASLVSATGAWTMTPSLLARIDASHLLGSYSNGWLATAGIAHVFVPEWRVAPFVGIGGGVVHVSPKATLVRSEDRTDETAYAGLGLRGYLTNRFLLQAEYRSYVVFTSRNDNEEIEEWTVGFTYFF